MSMSDAFLPVDGAGRLDPDAPVEPGGRSGVQPGDDEPDVLQGSTEPAGAGGPGARDDHPAARFPTPRPGERMSADELRAEIEDEDE